MKQKPEKTNGSQALGRALLLAPPATDGGVTNGDEDELSALPEKFGEMYRASYEAGRVSAWEAGYRQGYEAGFGHGRRQGDNGSSAAPAAVENSAGNSEVRNGEAGNGVNGMRKMRLFGLPCTNCGRWFFSDEACCPRCATPRVKAADGPLASRARKLSLPAKRGICGFEFRQKRTADSLAVLHEGNEIKTD